MQMPLSDPASAQSSLATHSRFYQRLHRRYDSELSQLAPGVPTHATMNAACDALLSQGHALGAALRILRQLVMERLISLDCDQQAPLDFDHE